MHPFYMNLPKGFDSKQYLYHYTKTSTAIEHILSKGTLQFSQFANLNDPKESRFEDINVFGNASLPFGDTRDRLIDFFRYKVKVACFSRDDQNIDHPHLYSSDMCSRGYAKPRMWATYGCEPFEEGGTVNFGEHRGVCLVFDKEKLKTVFTKHKNSNDIILEGPVNYGRAYDEILKGAFFADIGKLNEDFERTLYEMIDKYYQTYFLFKHSDWSTENEYRFILIGDNEKNELLKFENSMVGIAVGMDISEEDSDKIISLSNSIDIPVVQPEWGLTGSSMRMLNTKAQSLTM